MTQETPQYLALTCLCALQRFSLLILVYKQAHSCLEVFALRIPLGFFSAAQTLFLSSSNLKKGPHVSVILIPSSCYRPHNTIIFSTFLCAYLVYYSHEGSMSLAHCHTLEAQNFVKCPR